MWPWELDLKEVNQKLDLIIQKEKRIMALLDALTQAIQAEKTVEDSVLLLVTGLAQKVADLTAQLANAGTDPALVAQAQALTDEVNANAAAMAAAVQANTAPTP